jgi:CheY-like chemotaxis protein/nitrogen-specific signal transduction histidine kinase
MKKLSIILPLGIIVAILLELFFCIEGYQKQLIFLKKLVYQQTVVCGNFIEQTGYNFESDLNYIPFSDDVSHFISTKNIGECDSRKIEIFFSKYQQLISNISVRDLQNNIFSINKDKNNKFIKDYYQGRETTPLVTRDSLSYSDSEYVYYLPIFQDNKIMGNILVSVNINNYISSIFKNYYLEGTLWQWLVNNEGKIAYSNFPEKGVSIDELSQITGEVKEGNEGFLQHSFRLNGKKIHALSVFYPVRIFNRDMGIVFSINDNVVSSFVIKKNLFLGGLCIALLLAVLILLRKSKKQGIAFSGTKDSSNILSLSEFPFPAILTDGGNHIEEINAKAAELFMIKQTDKLKGKNLLKAFSSIKSKAGFENYYSEKVFTFIKDGLEVCLLKKSIIQVINGESFNLDFYLDIAEFKQNVKIDLPQPFVKSNLLAKLNHEIRTYTYGILGMSDALMVSRLDDTQKDFVETIKKSAELLTSIVNDILDFTKIDAGKIQIEEVPFSLREEINSTLEVFQNLAREKNLTLQASIEKDIPENLIGDPSRFRHVLSALLDNALKFTHEGEICVSVRKISDNDGNIKLEVEVDDSGVGIEKEKLADLQTDDQGTDATPARKINGIGLIIAKRLVALMNGELQVMSPSIRVKDEKHRGTTVTFTIEVFADGSVKKNLDFSRFKSFDEVKVLVATDSVKEDDMLLDILDDLNIDVELSLHPEKLLDHTSKTNEDLTPLHQFLVIYDTSVFDGFAIAERLFANKLSEKYLIVMISNNHKAGNILRSKNLGVDHYIIKPFEPVEINQILHKHFPSIQLKDKGRMRSGKKLSILVAEDNPINQKVAKANFSHLGYEIDIARNGHEVLSRLNENKYDIIFMDLIMPEKDGFETTKEIRQLGLKIPVVAMTAQTSAEDQESAFNAGVDDYIIKPVKIEGIKKMLIKFFA